MDNLPVQDKYATLDGLRGAAAALVVMVHFPLLFGLTSVENGYLVVDLFFAMSGFVIASAYEKKLAGGSLKARSFMKLRIIRLYPLYLIATLIGIVSLLLKMPDADWSLMAQAVPLALLMLPSPIAMRIFYPLNLAPQCLYPLNFPSWSLFFELCANGAYALFFKRLTTRTLVRVSVVCGVLLVAKGLHGKTLDYGAVFSGSYIGFLRVIYSFSIGVLLFRRRTQQRKQSNAYALAIVAVCLLIFCVPVAASIRPAYTVLALIVAIPLLVMAGASVEPTRKVREVFLFAGTVSYGIYVLHVPVIFIVQTLLVKPDNLRAPAHAVLGAALLVLVVALAAFAEKYYDRPVRRFLLHGRRKPVAARPAVIAVANNE